MQCLGHMLLMILAGMKLLEHFAKINCKKQIKKCLKLKKLSRGKTINYRQDKQVNGMVINGKDTIIPSIAGQIKKTI